MRTPGDLIIKDPESIEPEGFDWTSYLAELGDNVQIAESTWDVTGPDDALTLEDEDIVTGGLKTVAYLHGGTRNRRYQVTNHITTNSSPAVEDDRSFYVRIRNK